jgi:hypothetical protein
MKKHTGPRWEITVDGRPRSYRDRRQIAIESAEYLESKNPNVEVTVRHDDRRDDRHRMAAATA